MPRGDGETPRRSIRVEDELWAEAQRVAHDRDESVSDAIVRFLRRYVDSHPLGED